MHQLLFDLRSYWHLVDYHSRVSACILGPGSRSSFDLPFGLDQFWKHCLGTFHHLLVLMFPLTRGRYIGASLSKHRDVTLPIAIGMLYVLLTGCSCPCIQRGPAPVASTLRAYTPDPTSVALWSCSMFSGIASHVHGCTMSYVFHAIAPVSHYAVVHTLNLTLGDFSKCLPVLYMSTCHATGPVSRQCSAAVCPPAAF